MDKSKVEKIVEQFGDGRIGDVLEKIKEKHYRKDCRSLDSANFQLELKDDATRKLLSRWQSCGISKSLQQIAESGWEKYIVSDGVFRLANPGEAGGVERLKEPAASLFDFIDSLKLN